MDRGGIGDGNLGDYIYTRRMEKEPYINGPGDPGLECFANFHLILLTKRGSL
jgi:hypothetical protein